MNDSENHEYRINIDPRILELLGPSLYTNIYYVLAELIANSYDAAASNVYIVQKGNKIIVEDDGTGMSYQSGDIQKYLNVAVETRTNEKDSVTIDGKRRKMGRKGVGKLAALSVSEKVFVMTRKKGEKSGFVLSRHVGEDHKLDAIKEGDINFIKIKANKDGTSVVMADPEYKLHKTIGAIKNNLIKIFPLVNSDFRIHIEVDNKKISIESFDEEMIQGLGALIILGKAHKNLARYFDSQLPNKGKIEKRLLKIEPEKIFRLKLKNKEGNIVDYDLKIEGWIGAYRTTTGRKKEKNDFPDNFVSLLSNKKLGEYNILQQVGKNRLPEVYVVGQLHVDLFEETSLPDMALSNRQGYKTEDIRYQKVITYVRDELLPRIIDMRGIYATHIKTEKEKGEVAKQLKEEEQLRKRVDEYKTSASNKATQKIANKLGGKIPEGVSEIIAEEMNEAFPIMGLKRRVDSNKKKILISHFSGDKPLCDVIEKLLVFNNVPEEDIIYTSSDNVDSGVPAGDHIFDYLRRYFVDSYSDKKIFVIYVTSKEMAKEWYPVTEVGAGWITKSKHEIFTINNFQPKRPLDIDLQWHKSQKKSGNIILTKRQFNEFIKKILYIVKCIGYPAKDKNANEKELKRYITIK